MKHKFLTSLIVTMSLTGAVTTFTNVSQPQIVKANKSSDIFWQGFKTKTAKKYFKKWRKVVLLDDCMFEQEAAVDFPKLPLGDTYDYLSLPSPRPDTLLKTGSQIQLIYADGTWYARGKLLPPTKYYDWIFPNYYNGSNNNYSLSGDGEFNGYKFATPNSYSGVSTIFRTPRKVIVTKNVRADKLRMVIPLYKIHSVGHKTIKKGTILKVGAPTNHWNHEIWGKGVNPTHKYVWVVDRLTGWYKLID